MRAGRCRHPYAFLAPKLSSKQLQLHCQGGAAASQPRERAANPSLPGMLQVLSTNPFGFGTSCYPLRPPTSPAETKAALLLSLRITTALRRHGGKCRGHDAISMETCSIKTCVSHLFCPHGSQSSSQIKHVKHHCPELGNVCYREGTQRALEVLGRKFRICATPKQSVAQALGWLQYRHLHASISPAQL